MLILILILIIKVDDYKLNGYLAAIKDNISTIEESTTCSSKMLQSEFLKIKFKHNCDK